MGRTKRQRFRRQKRITTKYLNSEINTIHLIKWMTKHFWVNDNDLRIAEFSEGGRGVFSLKSLKENDVLIEIPLGLMITFKTLEENNLLYSFVSNCRKKISIHELLAIFVIIENHVGVNSEWYNYIKYLPTKEELCIPWLCEKEEIEYIPDELKNSVMECRNNVVESWGRIVTMYDAQSVCKHCSTRVSHVLTRDTYVWAYTLVNTRAVYIDPTEARKMAGVSLNSILSDEPSMALCPYLDMFNHSSAANIKAVLRTSDYTSKYCIFTENKVQSYEQIFISYGAHDNKKLLCQYGFILPDNQFDTIEFSLKEVISICCVNASSRQYKFLCDHSFNSDIYVTSRKFSFNMAAVLYVLTHMNDLDWSIRVYTSVFTKEQLKLMYSLAEILLKWKLEKYEKSLENARLRSVNCSRHFELCIGYLEIRVNFVKNIIGM